MKYTKDEPSVGVDKCFGGGGQTISDAPESWEFSWPQAHVSHLCDVAAENMS